MIHFTEFKNFNINNIELGKKIFYKTEFIDLNNIHLRLNNIYLRNGICYKLQCLSNKDVYFIDLEFNKDSEINNFFLDLEEKILQLLENDNFNILKSTTPFQSGSEHEDYKQYFHSGVFKNNFNSFLRVKIPHDQNEFKLLYIDKNNRVFNTAELEHTSYIDCEISCNGIWITNEGFGLSWNISTIIKN